MFEQEANARTMPQPREGLRWLFSSEGGAAGMLVGRWLFLRALGLIYFAAFYSLAFQIRGLIGPAGVLPANEYLERVTKYVGHLRYWYAPTVLWMGTGDHALMLLCWAGMTASLLVVVNAWPRVTLAICFVAYLSFVAVGQDFANYQSDGMLLEAGFLALFLAPKGTWPGWGARSPVTRAAWWMLLYEWFRIYFESGAVKLLSGDPMWRHLTAMDEYYQNGPLPTWIGWYVQHLPHWFQAGTAGLTLVMELGLVWLALCGRRARIVCFWIVTVWQVGVILTANYTFLNYLVLVLALLLLDDLYCVRWVPERFRGGLVETHVPKGEGHVTPASQKPLAGDPEHGAPSSSKDQGPLWARIWPAVKVAVTTVVMVWVFYAATAQMVVMFWRSAPLYSAPVTALEPFRVANAYGLFAVMTPHRYEVEFQGSDDGKSWLAYSFRYKPQDVMQRPGIYAPYQPRLDWNLWFASLGTWQEFPIVPSVEVALLKNDPAVLGLMAGNPFATRAPKYVRVVIWQYWFTSMAEKRATGAWWRRQMMGLYAPTLTMQGGKVGVVGMPDTVVNRE